MQKNLPDKEFFIGKPLPGMKHYVIKEHIGSGHNAHVFRAHSDALNQDLACKIIPKTNLLKNNLARDEWFIEAQKANGLRNTMVVKCSHHSLWEDDTTGIDCFVLCYDYVNGKNLDDHIKLNKAGISIQFVLDLLKSILELLVEMEGRDIKHGDMHLRNILVESPNEFEMAPKTTFRVTDFGAWTTSSEQRIRDDYEQLAITLKELLKCIDYSNSGITSRDKFIFNFLDTQFGRHLNEHDLNRDAIARRPELLYKRIVNLEKEFNEIEKNARRVKLISPFDGLSCEQISEDSTLKALYSDKFLGLERIQSQNNLMLTGPRGCGKSTVFKSLSLRHRVLVDDDKPETVDYVGVYYNCNSDLYFAFPRYGFSKINIAHELPLHYITATLLIEALETIKLWAAIHFEVTFNELEQRVSKMLWQVLDVAPPQQPNVSSFMALITWLLNERKIVADIYRLSKKVQDFNKDKSFFGPDMLLKFCHTLKDNFSFLSDRPFYFFIDDYSSPKITVDLQKNLNRLFMQRHASCFFKLSTESPVSYACEDIDGKNYVEGREFELVNLGLRYLQEDESKQVLFIDDVFARRFTAIETYPVKNLDSLIGDTPINNNAMAREIRTNGKVLLSGKEALHNLCSGDIHYIINLVAHMVEAAGGREGLNGISTEPRVASKKQNEVIRKEAGSFLDNLKAIHNGDKLVKIVTAFGNIANSYLKHKESKNEESLPPYQASRIEPLQTLSLSNEAKKIYDELLRYSVFIRDPRGKSRRGNIVPRLYLRRCLIPHFNLTFSKRDSIELDDMQLEKLFLHPDNLEREMKLTKPDDGQMNLL